jgi:hypothetical protein
MAVISDNLSAIRALAGARVAFDMTTWRLEDYLYLPYFAGFWGIVPGSVADEDSPFNECAPPISPPAVRCCCNSPRPPAWIAEPSTL